MNTFKKKSLHAAVLAGLAALGAAGTANAVHINPDGLGQVLVFPYYTVRNGNATAMSIVNTTSLTKIVKVRFLEGKNSREVLDFNLFLSPQDVWTGVVIPTAAGARLETGDNSCVTPSDLFGNAAGVIRTDGTLPLNDFKNYTYIAPTADNTAFGTLDRTREGYMEVLEMGVITNVIITGYIKHNSAGVPANCGALDAYDGLSQTAPVTAGAAGRFTSAAGGHITPPVGGQFGRASILNSAAGSNYAYEPTAVDGWWVGVAGSNAYFPSGDLNPNISLSAGISATSNVFITGTPTGVVPVIPTGVVTANWTSSRDAVSAIFMRDTVANEFLTDAGTVSKTDWVITMPTKKNHILVGTGVPAVGGRPFSNNFADTTPTGACDAYTLGMYNREEGTLSGAPGVILPSPRPPAVSAVGQLLCWEANVVEFGTTGLLGSNNNFRLLNGFDVFGSTTATTTGAAFATLSRRVLQGPNGWAFLGFGATALPSQAQQSITPLSATLNGVVVPGVHFGLPIIGTAFHNYTNTGVASAYGGVLPHKFTRNIQ